jgi:phosphoribosylaminoimidazole carboxylase (NCAIR synthetase)
MMVNLLGDEVKLAEEHTELLKEAKLYLYGKHEIKTERKSADRSDVLFELARFTKVERIMP